MVKAGSDIQKSGCTDVFISETVDYITSSSEQIAHHSIRLGPPERSARTAKIEIVIRI